MDKYVLKNVDSPLESPLAFDEQSVTQKRLSLMPTFFDPLSLIHISEPTRPY